MQGRGKEASAAEVREQTMQRRRETGGRLRDGVPVLRHRVQTWKNGNRIVTFCRDTTLTA